MQGKRITVMERLICSDLMSEGLGLGCVCLLVWCNSLQKQHSDIEFTALFPPRPATSGLLLLWADCTAHLT